MDLSLLLAIIRSLLIFIGLATLLVMLYIGIATYLFYKAEEHNE